MAISPTNVFYRLSVVPLVCKAWNRVTRREAKVWEICALDGKELPARLGGDVEWARAISWLVRSPSSISGLHLHDIDFVVTGSQVLPMLLGVVSRTLRRLDVRGCTFHIGTWNALACLQKLEKLEVEAMESGSGVRLSWATLSCLSSLRNLTDLVISFAANPYTSVDERNVDGPVVIGFPQNLEELRLVRCGVVDAVFEPGVFEKWRNMRALWLPDTYVRCLPQAVSALSKLEHLSVNFAANDDREPWRLPASLTTLTRLKHLELAGDGYRAFPVGVLSKMTWIEYLELTGVGLSEAEEWESLAQQLLPEMRRLASLGLQLNFLPMVPSALLRVSTLTRLDLRQNELDELAPGPYLSGLSGLMLGCNNFTHVPEALRGATGLQLLDLSEIADFEVGEADVGVLLGMPRLRHLRLGNRDKRWGQASLEAIWNLARRTDGRLTIDFMPE